MFTRRKARPEFTASDSAHPTIVVTEHGGTLAHLVTVDQTDVTLRAVCGAAFLPACLVTPPGPLCEDCHCAVERDPRLDSRPGRRT